MCKLESTEDFIRDKKLYRHNFYIFMSEHYPKYTYKSTVFSDAIYVTQSQNADLNIDFLELLNGKCSLDKYQNLLEERFSNMHQKDPFSRAKWHIDCLKKLQEHLKQANII